MSTAARRTQRSRDRGRPVPSSGAEPSFNGGGAPTPLSTGAIGVVGGRGGAGASTAAVALGRVASGRAEGVVLVDLDRFGGGLDLALGAEDVPGVRWPDLLASPGVADGPRMVRTLPAVDGLAVLSHARGGRNACVPPAGVVDDVIRGCAVTGMLVVIDLPRTDDAVTRAAVGRCGVLVVVVPAEVRACASAAAVVEALAPDTPDVRLLVRGPSPAGLQAEDVAVAVGVPTFAEIRPEPGLAGTLERGDPVAAGSRSPLRRWARAILADREES